MRLETISNVDILRYAYKGLSIAMDEERADERLDEMNMQLEELGDILEAFEECNPARCQKRVRIEAKYGDWYYSEGRNDDDEKEYYLYDAYGSMVNAFTSMTALKHYIRTGRTI